MREPADRAWLLEHSRRAGSQDSRQYGGRDQGISCEGLYERRRQSVGSDLRACLTVALSQEVRESLVGTCIVIDICSNDACYYAVASILLKRIFCVV